MDRETVREKVVEVLRAVQERNAEEMVELDDAACPLMELPGFDSLIGEEATVDLAEALGCEISDKMHPFGTKRDPASVQQIVDLVLEVVKGDVV